MEMNELQHSWQGMKTPRLSDQQIYTMVKHNSHPALQKGQRQVIIESTSFVIFLFIYYSMLDGNKKPFFVNALLVGTVLINLFQQLSIFTLNKHIGAADNIRASLKVYGQRIFKYYTATIITRLGLMTGIIIFSTYNITWNTNKIMMLLLIVIIFAVQLFFFHKLWKSRMEQLKKDILYFEE